MLFWEDMIALISMLEVLLFFMSIWTFVLNLSDLNIHITSRKNYIEIMPSSTPHQKLSIYHLPTRGRAGIKLGDAWYVSNISIIFDCFMPILYHFHIFLATFYMIYWTNLLIQCPVPVSVFPLFQCFAEKEYQTESKRNETFWRSYVWKESNPGDMESTSRKQRGRHEAGGAPTPLGAPSTLVGPSWLPSPTSFAYIYINTP